MFSAIKYIIIVYINQSINKLHIINKIFFQKLFFYIIPIKCLPIRYKSILIKCILQMYFACFSEEYT